MTLKRILVAIDESPIAAHAVDVASEIANCVNADLGFVHVIDLAVLASGEGVPAQAVLAEMKKSGLALFDRAALRTSKSKTAWQFLREGKPAAQIIEAANEWGADLIVIGTHGRSGMPRLFLGSTAEHVLRAAHCPVMVVKGAAAAVHS